MKYTLIFIFSFDMAQVLMVHKNKGPFPGCINGVGGKLEPTDKLSINGALREVLEETGLDSVHFLPLRHLVTEIFNDDTELHVFYTRLGRFGDRLYVKQIEDEKLEWFFVDELRDVRDTKLAGNGNIPYFINLAKTIEGRK